MESQLRTPTRSEMSMYIFVETVAFLGVQEMAEFIIQTTVIASNIGVVVKLNMEIGARLSQYQSSEQILPQGNNC